MSLVRYCLLDLECAPALDVELWLPAVEPDKGMTEELNAPIEAAKNLVDPTKIAADIAKKTAARDLLPAKIAADIAQRKAAQLEAASLDPDLCRIVAVGWETEEGSLSLSATLVPTVEAERAVLEQIWQLANPSRPMVGYGLTFYDAGVLVRRSQLLGVLVPHWIYRQGKYRHENIIELSDYLTLNGMIDQKKGHGLDYHCRRFGIEIEDAISGKDVGQAWADGQIELVRQHVRNDIIRIRKVAQRLGVIDCAEQDRTGGVMATKSQFDRALADLRQEIDILQAALARMEKAKAAKPVRKPKARPVSESRTVDPAQAVIRG